MLEGQDLLEPATRLWNSVSGFQRGSTRTSKRLAYCGSVLRMVAASSVPTPTMGILSSLQRNLSAFMTSRCFACVPMRSEWISSMMSIRVRQSRSMWMAW